MRRIAISDIHACAQTFRRLVEDQVRLQPGDTLYLLGDYVNRGPDYRAVFDFIWELKAHGVKVSCLRGNHEDRFLEAVDRGLLQAEPQYVNFIRTLPSYLGIEGYLLVHAGFNFAVRDPLSDTYAMRWIRGWEGGLRPQWLGDRQIVHGHVRKERWIIQQAVADRAPILGIDNGCFALLEPGQGSLCALDLDSRQLYFQPNLDMNPQEEPVSLFDKLFL